MFNDVIVLPRVFERHPDVSERDVISAVKNAYSVRLRNFDTPCHYALAGLDLKGRMLEVVGVKQCDGTLIVYHAMKLSQKMARELGLE